MAAVQPRYILALDLGTSGPKVALFTTQGEYLASESQAVPLLLLPAGGAEQEPEQWWQAICQAVQRLLARRLVAVDDILAIGLTTQWSGTVAVDRSGRPLRNAILWMDSRGAPSIRAILGGPLSVQGYRVDRLLHWIQLTGGVPGMAGKDSIAHILYLKTAEPALYRETDKFLEPVDYIGQRLTGRTAASFDSITLHWVTDNRNISAIRYDATLLRNATISRDKLPDLVPPQTVLGPLSRQAAQDLGLRPEVQVVIGSPDMHSTAVGSGAVRDYEMHLYLGTSSWLTCHVPSKKTDLAHNMAALPSGLPGRYLLTNEQECAGACLDYVRDRLFFPTDALGTGPAPADAYSLMEQMARQVPPGSEGLLFMPWLYGERSPVDDAYVRGGFLNQSLRTTRGQMVRAVLEGVAYNARWLLGAVEQFTGKRVEAINLVGGGAQSDVWCQIQADVFNRTIRQMQDPLQVSTRGAALLAALAMGYTTRDHIPDLVPLRRTFEPDPAARQVYDEMFREFIQAYKSLRGIYARLNARRSPSG